MDQKQNFRVENKITFLRFSHDPRRQKNGFGHFLKIFLGEESEFEVVLKIGVVYICVYIICIYIHTYLYIYVYGIKTVSLGSAQFTYSENTIFFKKICPENIAALKG